MHPEEYSLGFDASAHPSPPNGDSGSSDHCISQDGMFCFEGPEKSGTLGWSPYTLGNSQYIMSASGKVEADITANNSPLSCPTEPVSDSVRKRNLPSTPQPGAKRRKTGLDYARSPSSSTIPPTEDVGQESGAAFKFAHESPMKGFQGRDKIYNGPVPVSQELRTCALACRIPLEWEYGPEVDLITGVQSGLVFAQENKHFQLDIKRLVQTIYSVHNISAHDPSSVSDVKVNQNSVSVGADLEYRIKCMSLLLEYFTQPKLAERGIPILIKVCKWLWLPKGKRAHFPPEFNNVINNDEW